MRIFQGAFQTNKDNDYVQKLTLYFVCASGGSDSHDTQDFMSSQKTTHPVPQRCATVYCHSAATGFVGRVQFLGVVVLVDSSSSCGGYCRHLCSPKSVAQYLPSAGT